MYLHQTKHTHSWFTLVELIVGMTIFAVGMTAILGLLHSTIDTSIASRHEIVASNLLRENIELIKNARNTNVRSFTEWNKILTEWSASSNLKWGIYIIENDFTHTGILYDPDPSLNWSIIGSPVYMKDKTVWFPTDLEWRYNATRLYLDDHDRFTHTATSTGTSYASYIIISPLSILDATWIPLTPIKNGKNQWYILDARVITKLRSGYREYDLKTVITDWKK